MVNLDDAHTGRSQRPGQASAVAAGAFDADQANRAERAQPGQELGVASPSDREALCPQQAADTVERGGNMKINMGVYTAGDGASLYDGQGHPFQREGWHAPAGRPGL